MNEVAKIVLGHEIQEMTRIKKSRYRLPADVWVSPRMGSHGPRIKVATKPNSRFGKDDSISISIGENPEVKEGDPLAISRKDLDAIKKWIAMNRDVLMRHWVDDEYDDLDMKTDLKAL